LQSAAKPRLCEVLAQPVSAAWGTGPPETCWLEALRPLAAATHGLARVAAPRPAGRARACKREPLLRRMPAAGAVIRPQSACRPRCVRIFSITGCSRIAAMIFNSPPQFGQCALSISNIRLSSLAQLSRTGR